MLDQIARPGEMLVGEVTVAAQPAGVPQRRLRLGGGLVLSKGDELLGGGRQRGAIELPKEELSTSQQEQQPGPLAGARQGQPQRRLVISGPRCGRR